MCTVHAVVVSYRGGIPLEKTAKVYIWPFSKLNLWQLLKIESVHWAEKVYIGPKSVHFCLSWTCKAPINGVEFDNHRFGEESSMIQQWFEPDCVKTGPCSEVVRLRQRIRDQDAELRRLEQGKHMTLFLVPLLAGVCAGIGFLVGTFFKIIPV